MFCGGFTKQHQINGGKCGECGDAWELPIPRPHEYGGKYGQGVTVRKYNPGSVITLRVELTASHMGYFEFRLCDDINARQICLDKNILSIISGAPFVKKPSDLQTRFYPRNGSQIYEIKAQLPKGVVSKYYSLFTNFNNLIIIDLECQHCVLQWKYIAGNNWGTCADGSGAVGCGAQEEFRACSDIAIGKGSTSAIPTIKPPTNVKPSTDKWPTNVPNNEENEIDHTHHDHDEHGTSTETTERPSGSNFFGAIIAVFTFFLVLCAIAAIYFYFYHGDILKTFLQRNQRNNQKTPLNSASSNSSTISSSEPPMRPPRTKRFSQTLKDIQQDHSSILVGCEKKSNSDA